MPQHMFNDLLERFSHEELFIFDNQGCQLGVFSEFLDYFVSYPSIFLNYFVLIFMNAL